MDALKTQHSNTPILQQPIARARLAAESFSTACYLLIDSLKRLMH